MGLLRWIFGFHRRKDDDEEEEREAKWKRKAGHRGNRDPNAYRIEVDGESKSMRGEGPPFSFWASARIILILSFLLWWIQPAGPMIAGYVGGRRSGSSMKGVVAAILPVVAILIANTAYERGVASYQIDFVASLPQAVAGGIAGILPFLMPYKDFLVGYMTGFAKALQNTFGMGTNGYLMVIIFAYIGGLIADQTRRELFYKSGSSQSVGFNLIQPLWGGHRPAEMDDGDYYEEDEELRAMRRPVRAHARGHGQVEIHTGTRSRRRRYGRPDRFEDYRKLGGEPGEGYASRHGFRARARDEEEDDEEVVAPRVHRASHASAKEHHARAQAVDEEAAEEDEAEVEPRYSPPETHRPRQRSHDEEVAIQRFVERALRQYEHPAR